LGRSATFERIHELVKIGDWSGSDHALLRLEEHGIVASELADRIDLGLVIEDYPGYYAGSCLLVLQEDGGGPVHALWGLMQETDRPAVLISAYRPDAEQWHDDNRTRRL
jgi:hypothetical protein